MDLEPQHQFQHQHLNQVADQDCTALILLQTKDTCRKVKFLSKPWNSTSPIIAETTRNLPQQQNMGKRGRKKTSQSDQYKIQPQPGTSNSGTNKNPVIPPRNLGTGRPHMQCSACGGNNHLRKDCHQDNFCTRCRSRLHATHVSSTYQDR